MKRTIRFYLHEYLSLMCTMLIFAAGFTVYVSLLYGEAESDVIIGIVLALVAFMFLAMSSGYMDGDVNMALSMGNTRRNTFIGKELAYAAVIVSAEFVVTIMRILFGESASALAAASDITTWIIVIAVCKLTSLLSDRFGMKVSVVCMMIVALAIMMYTCMAMNVGSYAVGGTITEMFGSPAVMPTIAVVLYAAADVFLYRATMKQVVA